MSTSLQRVTAFWVILLVVSAPNLFAQNADDTEFGVIPDSLYKMQPPSEYPDVSHVITNKTLDVSFEESGESIVAVLEHHVRMKVFDATAREASIVAIPYYFDEGMEQISAIKGYTYLPSGEKRAISEQDIRTININSRYNVKEFSMPGVRDGAILEYSYVIHRRYIEELPDFFLSDRVPTLQAELTITYPKYLRYQSLAENFRGRIKHDFVYTDTSSVPKIFTIPQPPPVVTERWIAHDIPPVEEEAFISSVDDYRAKLKFLLSEFGIPRQELENSWKVVVARIREKTNPWVRIQQNKFARSKGDSIARALGEVPARTVQDSIYRYVNERVNFSGAHSPYSVQASRSVLAGQPADQAAINQTLITMLRGAGIEASPVLISTRQSGKVNMDFPSFYQFNGQLVRSKISGEEYLMDASFAHSNPDLIPVDSYNGEGLVIDPNSHEWISIQPAKSKFDIDVQVDAALQTDGTLSGRIKAVQKGYPAQLVRQQYADGKGDAEILKRVLFDGYPQIKLDSVHTANVWDYNSAIELAARFEIKNYATSFTDGLKFRPMIVGYQRENPFKDTNRKYPITLDAPEQLDVSYSISLPEGYSAPAGRHNQSLGLPGAMLREIYDAQPNKLNYKYHINIDKKEFRADLFPQLYNLYERWVELSNSAWLIRK